MTRARVVFVAALAVLAAVTAGVATGPGLSVAFLSDGEAVGLSVSAAGDPDVARVCSPGSTPGVSSLAAVAGSQSSTTVGTHEGNEPDAGGVPTAEEAGGSVVYLDPVGGRTIDVGTTVEYDVVLRGATEGIISYDLSIGLSNPSVAAFEGFDHHEFTRSSTTETESGIVFDVSAGMGSEVPTAVDTDHEVVLGTVTLAGTASGETDIELANESGHTLTVYDNSTETQAYDIDTTRGSELTIVATDEEETGDRELGPEGDREGAAGGNGPDETPPTDGPAETAVGDTPTGEEAPDSPSDESDTAGDTAAEDAACEDTGSGDVTTDRGRADREATDDTAADTTDESTSEDATTDQASVADGRTDGDDTVEDGATDDTTDGEATDHDHDPDSGDTTENSSGS